MISLNLPVAKAGAVVIVYQSYRLHEGVTNRGANKLEAALRKILAYSVRNRRVGNYFRSLLSSNGFTLDKAP